MEEIILRSNFWNHFRKLWILALYVVGAVFLLWASNFEIYMYFFVGVFLVSLVLPTVIIHVNHYNQTRNRIVILSNDGIKVEGLGFQDIQLADMDSITVYLSAVRQANLGPQSFPFEDYFYCKIRLKDGGVLYLSCLMSDKIDTLLEERYGMIPFDKKRRYYPYISHHD